MTISTEELQKNLKKYLESRITSGRHIKVSSPVRITSGWETDVYSFKSEYESDGKLSSDDLILRLYPGDGAEEKAAKEFNAMAQLHRVGFPVPKVYWLEIVKSTLGKPFVIMEKVNGQSMGEALNESENTKKTMLRLFCKIFVDLHRLDVTPFVSNRVIVSDPSVYEINNPYGYLNKLLADFKRGMASLITDDRAFDLLNKIISWLEERKSSAPSRRWSLAHLDYHPYNILIRNDGTPFVIDWTNFDITDYRLDLAWTLLLCSTYGDPEMRDHILRTYERTAESKVVNIEYFEVIAATRRIGSIYLSLRNGAEKLGMLPETVETMRKQKGHIDAVIKVLSDRTGIALREFDMALKI